jgi:1,4-alpha-glucan branching enzyme
MDGFLTLIVTAHAPYLRTPGHHPRGEEMLHELTAFGLIPALNTLYDLRAAGQEAPIGLAISPILLEQLADAKVQRHFAGWMDTWLVERMAALSRWERQRSDHPSYLARFELDWGRGILRAFEERYHGNLTQAVRDLCGGLAEPLGGAATHAYLPLLQMPESHHAQIQIGMQATARLLGRMPEGFWLPECGFDPVLAPALGAYAVRYIVADPSCVEHEVSQYVPYWTSPERLQILLRDPAASELVWSSDLGYRGDPVYRSAQRDPRTGMRLWRNGLGQAEELYDPYDAFRRAEEHADHFLRSISAMLHDHERRDDRAGVVVLPIDLELLGRTWFEGSVWLRAVLEGAMRGRGPALATPAEYLRSYRPQEITTLRSGSWGVGGDHRAWNGRSAEPIWGAIAEAEQQLAGLVTGIPDAHGLQERVLNQAVRDLLLAQSSDWPLLASQGVLDEALQHVGRHIDRCERLCQIAESPITPESEEYLADTEALGNAFPFLNYRMYRAKKE